MSWLLATLGAIGLLADIGLLVFVFRELRPLAKPRDWDVIMAWTISVAIQVTLGYCCLMMIITGVGG